MKLCTGVATWSSLSPPRDRFLAHHPPSPLATSAVRFRLVTKQEVAVRGED